MQRKLQAASEEEAAAVRRRREAAVAHRVQVERQIDEREQAAVADDVGMNGRERGINVRLLQTAVQTVGTPRQLAVRL